MRKKIDNNNLMPWFTDDHDQLPEAYVKSCQKFFDELKAASSKHQATSLPQSGDIITKNRKEKNGN